MELRWKFSFHHNHSTMNTRRFLAGHMFLHVPIGVDSGRGQDRTLKRMTPVEFRLKRGPALPHGRVQPAHLHRHPLEYRPSRRSGQTADTRRADSRARSSGPHLTLCVDPHPAHRRIPMAKAPMAVLAYDSTPYRSRPVVAGGTPESGYCPVGHGVALVGFLSPFSVYIWARFTAKL